jgi:non-ribosomal peptide synthase protein (TIGR01720 family)
VQLLLDASVDAGALRAALLGLPEQHDALRLRFRPVGGGLPVQSHDIAGAVTLDLVDLAGQPAAQHEAVVSARAADLAEGLDLERGPLLRGVLFRAGPDDPARLLLVAHHLVVDGVSWRILVTDLVGAYGEHARGRPPRWPAKTTSFRAWAERLVATAGSADVLGELDYWLGMVGAAGAAGTGIAAGAGGAAGTAAPACSAVAGFDDAETALLLSAPPAAYGIGIPDVLLAALVNSLAAASGERSVLVDLEAHGRDARFDDVDLSRTVGWFTSMYPVRFAADPDADARAALLAVKERLRGVPGGGTGWGLLRYCAGAEVAAKLAALPRATVGFNYLGRLDGAAAGAPVLGLAATPAGPAGLGAAGDAAARHPLEVTAGVIDGRLGVRCIGTSTGFGPAVVDRLAADLTARVRGYLRHLAEPAAGGYSPSDFPDAGLRQDELDALVAQLADAGLDV